MIQITFKVCFSVFLACWEGCLENMKTKLSSVWVVHDRIPKGFSKQLFKSVVLFPPPISCYSNKDSISGLHNPTTSVIDSYSESYRMDINTLDWLFDLISEAQLASLNKPSQSSSHSVWVWHITLVKSVCQLGLSPDHCVLFGTLGRWSCTCGSLKAHKLCEKETAQLLNFNWPQTSE